MTSSVSSQSYDSSGLWNLLPTPPLSPSSCSWADQQQSEQQLPSQQLLQTGLTSEQQLVLAMKNKSRVMLMKKNRRVESVDDEDVAPQSRSVEMYLDMENKVNNDGGDDDDEHAEPSCSKLMKYASRSQCKDGEANVSIKSPLVRDCMWSQAIIIPPEVLLKELERRRQNCRKEHLTRLQGKLRQCARLVTCDQSTEIYWSDWRDGEELSGKDSTRGDISSINNKNSDSQVIEEICQTNQTEVLVADLPDDLEKGSHSNDEQGVRNRGSGDSREGIMSRITSEEGYLKHYDENQNISQKNITLVCPRSLSSANYSKVRELLTRQSRIIQHGGEEQRTTSETDSTMSDEEGLQCNAVSSDRDFDQSEQSGDENQLIDDEIIDLCNEEDSHIHSHEKTEAQAQMDDKRCYERMDRDRLVEYVEKIHSYSCKSLPSAQRYTSINSTINSDSVNGYKSRLQSSNQMPFYNKTENTVYRISARLMQRRQNGKRISTHSNEISSSSIDNADTDQMFSDTFHEPGATTNFDDLSAQHKNCSAVVSDVGHRSCSILSKEIEDRLLKLTENKSRNVSRGSAKVNRNTSRHINKFLSSIKEPERAVGHDGCRRKLQHNVLERKRRHGLKACFTALEAAVRVHCARWRDDAPRVPRVRLLALAVRIARELGETGLQLDEKLRALKARNGALRRLLQNNSACDVSAVNNDDSLDVIIC